MEIAEEKRVARATRWNDLIYTGPGTPMGKIMRQYWQPALESRSLVAGKPKSVKLLGETFTAYRGESGRPYLVAERCPHRGALLKAGTVEGENIRCIYHGWMFNGTGQCVQAPAETAEFAAGVRTTGKPAADYGGWVFVYLGEGEPPPLPKKAEIDDAAVIIAKGDVWPCNWLQLRENSCDPMHVNFTHRVGPLGAAVTDAIPKIEFEQHPWGFQTKAVRSATNQRITEKFFPNSGLVIVPQPNDYSMPWINLFFWHVPIDDNHCATYKTYASKLPKPAADRLLEWFDSVDFNISPMHDELFESGIPSFSNSMHLTEAQDYVAQVGQGTIADRGREYLGTSDVAILKFREAMLKEIEPVKNGQAHRRWENKYGPSNLPVPPRNV